MLAALVVLSALAIVPYVPRDVTPATASAELFSAERALPHLQAIAQRPHPLGSAEDAAVRDYILQQLSSFGLQPEVQHATVFDSTNAGAAIVDNVLVRLPGATRSAPAVLVAAHYDSVQSGPGAGDNSMAVASMLETVRAVRSGPRLPNDVIFLFDDGEEPGLYGSMAFVQQHPWARDVGVVFDFDADGASGPTTLLWTTPDDTSLISELAKVGPGIVAQPSDMSSMRAKRNNDLHVFAASGFRGAHFDIVGGESAYHTQRDNVSSLDLPSMQTQGNLMLAIVRHFGGLSLERSTAGDATFLTPFGSPLWYPSSWNLPLATLAAVAALGITIAGLRRRRLSPGRLAAAVLVLVAITVGAAAVGHLLWQPLLAGHPESQSFGEADFYGQAWYVSGLYLLALGLGFAVWPSLATRFGQANVAAAGVLAGAATALVLAIVLPWASYLEIWPVLIAACGLAYLLSTGAIQKPGWLWLTVLVLVAVPATALAVSGLYQSVLGGVQGSPALVIAVLVLLIGLLSPQVLVATAIARHWLPAIFGLIGVGLLSVGFMSSGYTASQPRPDTAAYALNSATGQAFWATADEHLDGYTSQLLTDPVPRTLDELIGAGGSSMLVSSPAPTAQLAPPVLALRDRRTDGETQTLSLHLASQRGAWRAVVFPGPGVELITAAFGDTASGPVRTGSLQIVGLPPEGADFTMTVRASGPLELIVLDQTMGLPDFPGVPPRPAIFMSAPAPDDLRGYPTFVSARMVAP